jgi:hypothetical protein
VAEKGHSEEQILRALRQAESGIRVAEICREHGIRDQPLELPVLLAQLPQLTEFVQSQSRILFLPDVVGRFADLS